MAGSTSAVVVGLVVLVICAEPNILFVVNEFRQSELVWPLRAGRWAEKGCWLRSQNLLQRVDFTAFLVSYNTRNRGTVVTVAATAYRLFVARLAALAPLARCGRVEFEPIDRAVDGPAVDSVSAGCNLAADFGTPQLLPGVSSDATEATLRLLPNELVGYLWTTRSGNIDLARVTRSSLTEPFSYQPFDDLNTLGLEFEPTVSSDDLSLVFRAERDGAGADLYLATRATTADPYVSLGRITNVVSPAADYQPYLTDTHLLFVSNRNGSERIFAARRNGNNFEAPAELNELAAPVVADNDPVLSADGLTIYFASTRRSISNDMNIWVATRPSVTAPFGDPRLLPNVNSTATDGPSWISPDQCRLYLSSDRRGNPDLYVATRP